MTSESLTCIPGEQNAPQRRTSERRRLRGAPPCRYGRDAEHRQNKGDAHEERVRRRTHELHDHQAQQHHTSASVRDGVDVADEVSANRLQHPAEPDDQRRQRHVPDERHPIIIIAALHEHVRNVEGAIRAEAARSAPLDAYAQLFLLRLARLDARDDLVQMLGDPLAHALIEHRAAGSVPARAAWLELFIEAQRVFEDVRLLDAIDDLTRRLRHDWTAVPIADSAAAIGGTLRAAMLPAYQQFAPAAVDELERVIGAHYVPGRALGSFGDEVHAASALLAAYELSGRLPYSMLAEELMLMARRHPSHGFDDACAAARVLCRLAVLHDDPDYRAAAVVAPRVDYRGDAAGLLTSLWTEAHQRGAAAGIYGLALLELESASLLQ